VSKSTSDAYLADYLNEQTLAEKMIPTVGMMYREMGVIISVFGRKLMNSSTIDIIKAHRSGQKIGDLEKRASLLRRDSIHGPFNGSIRVDHENSAIIANGNYIKVIYAGSPEDIDYTEHGIDNALIVDNTGVFKDEAALGRHLTPKGAAKVLLTAPAKGAIKNIVYGVNHQDIDPSDTIVCAASCTTNALHRAMK